MTKQCTKCKQLKPISEFSRNQDAKDGRHSNCKQCQATHHLNWLKLNKDKEGYRAKRRVAAKKYRSNYPEVIKAHGLAQRNKEKLIKSVCERCGASEELHMHHPDYNKPLEVVTLCNRCHVVAHHGRIYV